MPQIPEIYDCIGNPVDKDNMVVACVPFPLVFKVVIADRGGLHDAEGRISPAKLRLITDVNLAKMPGLRFTEIVRVVIPSEQDAMARLLNSVGGRPRS
jgi:hypothetical protein